MEYLADEGGIVGVFEVAGQDFFGEGLLLDYDEADARLRPSNCMAILLILNQNLRYLKYIISLLQKTRNRPSLPSSRSHLMS